MGSGQWRDDTEGHEPFAVGTWHGHDDSGEEGIKIGVKLRRKSDSQERDEILSEMNPSGASTYHTVHWRNTPGWDPL